MAVQPHVTTVGSQPATRGCGIITSRRGSRWCKGKPTIWIPGHKDFVEDRPMCFIDNRWRPSKKTILDKIDDLNSVDNNSMDRHDCGVLDINNDGIDDIYCLVGANKGRGYGYNELYLTQNDGSLLKIRRHALQRFKGARTRHTTTLNSVNGTTFVFITASYGERADGKMNMHAMFRTNFRYKTKNVDNRYFDHIRGPWQRHTNASCAISADINQDGLDDLIVCNEKLGALIYVQNGRGGFRTINVPEKTARNWRSARVADLNGDGIPDLAVVYHSENESFLRVFKGRRKAPYFIFSRRGYFTRPLPYAAPDLEALDVNGDGAMDLYIVQANERRKRADGTAIRNNYCGGRLERERWWSGGPNLNTPPKNWVPPRDIAPDLLLLGNRNRLDKRENRFKSVAMKHREPGCGYFVKKFGKRSLVLAQGGFVRPGHQLLLQWSQPASRQK